MRRGYSIPDPTRAEKRRLRKLVLDQRSRLQPEWVRAQSAKIATTLTGMDEFSGSAVVCCYTAMSGEVATDGLFAECWRSGRKLCVPAFSLETREYELALIGPDTVFAAGRMGVREPVNPEWFDLSEVDLMVVPGLAFDGMCRRLGHGGGHYDKILGLWETVRGSKGKAVKIGLAFEFQIFAEVIVNERDIGLDVVVTEKRTIRRGV